MGQRRNIPAFISLCLSQEKGTEGSDLLLHLGSPFFICSCELYDYKAHESVLITHCPELDHSGSLYRFLHGWCTRAVRFLMVPWGRKLPAGLQSKHSGSAQLFRKGILALFGSGQGFKLPSTSHGGSSTVGKLCCHKDPLKADFLGFPILVLISSVPQGMDRA